MKNDKPSTRHNSSSTIEYLTRVNKVQGWILQDIPVDLMLRQMDQLGWGSLTTRYKILGEARDRWIRNLDQDTDTLVKLKLVELQERKRTLKEEYRGTPAGIKALNEIDKMIIDLLGLNKPIQVRVKNEITRESVKDYSTDQLLALMESGVRNN